MKGIAEASSKDQVSTNPRRAVSVDNELQSGQSQEPEFRDAAEAIKHYMALKGLTQRDLVPMIGSRSKVSEVLSGTRAITMPMARALHRHLQIPAEDLLKEPAIERNDSDTAIDWRRFPLNQMAARGWIEKRSNLREHAKELVSGLMLKAGLSQFPTALYRKNDHNRANAMANPYALNAWCWQVLAQANRRTFATEYQQSDDPAALLRQIATLSSASDGPRQAVEFLATQGIAVEIVRHLPGTHLDGAAMKSSEGRPVVGMTLRYDRIDNFWFVLFHELAHVVLHLYNGNDGVYRRPQAG